MLGELRQFILAADVVAAQLERSHTENVARLEAETLRLQLEASQLRSQLEEKDVALQSTIMDLESCRGMREELRRSCVASRKEGMYRLRCSASLSASPRMQLAFAAWRKRRHTSGLGNSYFADRTGSRWSYETLGSQTARIEAVREMGKAF